MGKVRQYVQLLSIRCRDANTLNGKGTIQSNTIETDDPNGNDFDDLAYSNGARPVSVRLWISDGIDSIQIDYSNQPVELCTENCDGKK